MDRTESLFETVLGELDRHGVLSRVILIGGWCLPMYREHFRHPPEIPLLRTVDMDFLIPRLPPAARRVDVPGVLERHGFSPSFAVLGGAMKFVHPEMEIEFMIPARGQGGSTAQAVAPWGITAQRLRFLGLIAQHVLEVDYNGLVVKVPEPSVFVLLKYLISGNGGARRSPSWRTPRRSCTACQSRTHT